ncbi:monovalent cation/H(+) antiporter subunit G [Chungangia koreensis]|uniref:Monovalent cation/H(+) antiporter subunit G n=1 Tax=Chungangia koreensis TaxID=752657 RepID=A0ABV8X8D2_9LACT
MIFNILIGFFIIVGLVFTIVGAIGLIRLPDVYTRAHAASKSSTLGVMSILFGVFLYFWLIKDHVNPHLIIAIVFLFATSPIGGHLMGRAAYIHGIKPIEGTKPDDYKDELLRRKASK